MPQKTSSTRSGAKLYKTEARWDRSEEERPEEKGCRSNRRLRLQPEKESVKAEVASVDSGGVRVMASSISGSWC